jgi:hypothetical protein
MSSAVSVEVGGLRGVFSFILSLCEMDCSNKLFLEKFFDLASFVFCILLMMFSMFWSSLKGLIGLYLNGSGLWSTDPLLEMF